VFFFGFFINEIVLNINAKLFQKDEKAEDVRQKFKKLSINTTPIVYNKGYNITAFGLEKMHPFDSTKYMRIWDFLLKSDTLNIGKLKCYHDVRLPSRRWLLNNMSSGYLRTFNVSFFVSKYVELPLFFLPGWFLRSQMLEPMMLGSKGSVDAAFLAMHKGWAINLAGGFHHATRENGEGFCVFPDITFVTYYLRKIYNVKKILIIDLDAHQGNGHERDHMGDANTFIIDAYNHSIYPGDAFAKKGIHYDIDINSNTTDAAFIKDINKGMTKAMEEF